MEEFDLDVLLDQLQGSETLNECVDRLAHECGSLADNSLHGFWNPVEAARVMPVTPVIELEICDGSCVETTEGQCEGCADLAMRRYLGLVK